MRTAWCPTTLVFVFTAFMAQQNSLGDAPRFLFGTAVRLTGDAAAWNMVTTNGLQMYLTSRQPGGDYDIYVAERSNIDEPFGEPKTVANVNSPRSDIGPSISSNGLELYFWSWFPDGLPYVGGHASRYVFRIWRPDFGGGSQLHVGASSQLVGRWIVAVLLRGRRGTSY